MNFIKKLFGSGGGGGGGSETSNSASVDRLEQLGIDKKDLVYRSRSSTSVNRQSGTIAVLQTFNSRSQQTGYTVREVKMSSSKHVVQVLPGLFLGENKNINNIAIYYSIYYYKQFLPKSAEPASMTARWLLLYAGLAGYANTPASPYE